ncbi:MAG: LOW QUALITY PROTEIN: hypothetical protein KVP17_000950 [Porospora cf. gigantea B]|uniref:uncharacterized protein n=1 Tax=Porospora cf. gigantea B TaxID=2853592 RepID=UPI003571D9E7|nr:MAG: LOW QUALITY PROTEIN: hypothetical protein KVP17_000950 [Porospora cf. gigantea B]
MGERIIRDIQSIVHSDGWLDLGLERFVQVKRQQANVIGAITSGSLLSQMLLLPPTASSEDIAAAADTAQRLLSEDLLSSDKQSAGDTARLKLSSYYGPWLSNLQQAEETRRQLEELESRKRDAEEVELRGRMTKMKAYVQFLLTMDGTNQSKVNPFYSLGLPPTYASAAVMRKLKKELVVMTHPDKVPATPEFADLKEKAKSAFQIVPMARHLQACSSIDKCIQVISQPGFRPAKFPIAGVPPPYAHVWSGTPLKKDVPSKMESRLPRQSDSEANTKSATTHKDPKSHKVPDSKPKSKMPGTHESKPKSKMPGTHESNAKRSSRTPKSSESKPKKKRGIHKENRPRKRRRSSRSSPLFTP